MKYIEEDALNPFSGKFLEQDTAFQFRCHPEIGCFNRCCRNLNLFLYPYDVVRLRKGLKISSDRFLDRYVDVVLRPGDHFPDVLLKMEEGGEHPCVFLSDSGCTVYLHRPHTCRLYPLEQGLSHDAASGVDRRVHLFRPFAFCLGQFEPASWTPETWADDQEAGVYSDMTVLWSELKRLFRTNPWGKAGLSSPKGKMAFMAAYNIDRFREFVFNSSFLTRHGIAADTADRIRNSDTELLKFGFQWIQYLVWGTAGPDFRQIPE